MAPTMMQARSQRTDGPMGSVAKHRWAGPVSILLLILMVASGFSVVAVQDTTSTPVNSPREVAQGPAHGLTPTGRNGSSVRSSTATVGPSTGGTATPVAPSGPQATPESTVTSGRPGSEQLTPPSSSNDHENSSSTFSLTELPASSGNPWSNCNAFCMWVTPQGSTVIGTGLVTWGVYLPIDENNQGDLSWSGLPAGCQSPPNSFSFDDAGNGYQNYTCTPSQTGAFSAYATTHDTQSDGSCNPCATLQTNIIQYTVSPVPLSIQTPTASPVSVDVGSSSTFQVGISWDDTGGFVTFSWSNLPQGCTSSNDPWTNGQGANLFCTPTGAGTSGVTATANLQIPSIGYTESATSNPMPFTVYQDPTVAIAAAPTSVDLGQTVTFTATPSYGVGPFSYSWSGLPAGCAGAHSATITCTPSSAGGNSVTATATDHSGDQVSSSALSFTIYPDPTVSTPTANPASVDVGQSVTFSVTASGGYPGSGGYAYAWNLPPGCSSTATSFSCIPTQAGTTSVSVKVTDSDSYSVTSTSLSFVVAPPIQTAAPSVLVSSSAISTGSATAAVFDPQNNYVYVANENQNTLSVVNGGVVIQTISGGFNYPDAVAYDSASQAIIVSNLEGDWISAVSGSSVTIIPFPSTGFPGQIAYDPANQDLYVGMVDGGTAMESVVVYSGITYKQLATVPVYAGNIIGVAYDSADGYVYATESWHLSGGNGVWDNTVVAISGQSIVATIALNTGSCVIGPSQLVFDPGDGYVYATGLADNCPYVGVISGTSSVGSITIPGWTGGGGNGMVYDPENGYLYLQTLTGLSEVIYGTTIIAASSVSTGGGPGGQLYIGTYDPETNVIYMPGGGSGNGQLFGLEIFTASSLGGETGETVTFFEGQHGYAGYSYTWSGLPTGCPGADAPQVNCTIQSTASGSYTVDVKVTDGNGNVQTSPNLDFTIYQPPSISPTLTRTSVDIGQSSTFSTTLLAGTGQYQLSWGLPSGCTTPPSTGSSNQKVSVTCAPTTTGTATISLNVVDSNLVSTSSSASFSVDSDPTIPTPTSSAGSMADSGRVVGFTASASGGTGTYSYLWTGLPSGCPASNSVTITCTPASVMANTTYQVAVTVTDTNGYQVPSGVLAFTLNAVLTIRLITAAPSSLDGGQNLSLKAQVSGGTGVYVFLWGLPQGCLAKNSSIISCTLTKTTANATSGVNLGLGDSLSSIGQGCDAGCVYSTLPLSISATPYVTAPTPSLTSVDNGQNVTFSAKVVGGTGSYDIHWTGLPAGCKSYDTLQLTCKPNGITANATYSVGVTVSDTNLDVVTNSTLAYAVDADPTTSPQSLPLVIDIGETVAYSANAQAGSGGYNYVWSGLPQGCSYVNAARLSCLPTASGVYPLIKVQVTDSNHYPVTSVPITTTVNPPLGTPTLNESRQDMDANETIYLNSSVSGGSAPYTFNYSGLPSGCNNQQVIVSGNHSTLACLPTLAGNYTVAVTVTDSTPSTSNPSPGILFEVYRLLSMQVRPPAPGSLGLSQNPSINETVTNSTGAIYPDVWWSGGEPGYTGCLYAPGSMAPVECYRPSAGQDPFALQEGWPAAGVYPVKVTFVDSSGKNISFSWNVSVYWPLDMGTVSGAPVVDSGIPVTFNASLIHGAPPVSFWYNDTTTSIPLCTGGNLTAPALLSCQHDLTTVGANTVELTVRTALADINYPAAGDPEISTQNWTITVSPAFANNTLSAVSGSYSSKQGGNLTTEVSASVALNGSFSGGTAPYTCAYILNSTSIQSFPATRNSCPTPWVPSSVGKFTLTLTISDATHQSRSASMSVTVAQTLTAHAVQFSMNSPDAGTAVNITVNVTGGLPGYSYSWSFGDGVTQTTTVPWIVHAWATNGTFVVSVGVTDGAGVTKGVSTQAVVIPDPAVLGLSIQDGPISDPSLQNGDPLTLPTGMTATFNVSENGGSSPYTYVWTFGGVTVGNSTVPIRWSALHLTPTTVGTFTLQVTITDSQGHSTRIAIPVTALVDVVGNLKLSGVNATEDAGSTGNVSVTFTGGFAPVTYHWTENFPNSTVRQNTTVPWLTVAWDHLGSATITLLVVDGFGANATVEMNVSVVDTLQPTASTTLTSTMIDAGMWDNLSVVAAGGHGPYAYLWKFTVGGKSSFVNTTVPWLNRTWSAVGLVSISVIVTDEFVAKASASGSFTVSPDLQVLCAPTVTGTPVPGASLTFTLSCAQGGSSPYTYRWDLGGVSKTTTSSQFTTSFSDASTYSVSVIVTDGAGVSVASQTLTVGTVPPAISNVTATPVSSALNGSKLFVSLDTAIQASDPDGQVILYRYSMNLSNLSTAPWVNSTIHAIYLNVSKATSMVDIYFQVQDNMGRVSTSYQLPLNTSTLLPGQKTGPGNAGESGMSTGEIFLILIGIITLVMVAIVAFMSLRQRNRRSLGSVQVSTSAPPDVLTPVIAAQVKETPGQSLDLLAHTVATKTKTTLEFAKTEIAQLASTGLIEKRWEKGEEHYYPVEGSAESSEEESIRRDLETKTAVYSALEGKGWMPLETLHEATQAQTRLTRDQLAKWISDYNGEFRIECRPAGDSLEVRLENQAQGPPSQEVVVDPAVLSTIQLDDRAVQAPEFPEPKGPAKPSRSRRSR